MIRKARVVRLMEDGRVEIEVQRETACSGECSKCQGCSAPNERIRAVAQCAFAVEVGDLVDVEMESAKVLRAAAVVYVLPLVLFFAGLFVGAGVARLQAFQGLLGGAGLALGLLLAIVYNRRVTRRQSLRFQIVNKS